MSSYVLNEQLGQEIVQKKKPILRLYDNREENMLEGKMPTKNSDISVYVWISFFFFSFFFWRMTIWFCIHWQLINQNGIEPTRRKYICGCLVIFQTNFLSFAVKIVEEVPVHQIEINKGLDYEITNIGTNRIYRLEKWSSYIAYVCSEYTIFNGFLRSRFRYF